MPYILTILTAALVTIGSLMGTQVRQTVQTVIPDAPLGADIKLFAGFPYYLAGTGISSSASSFTLTSFTIPQTGQEILDGDLESTFYFTLEPGNRTRQEIIGCTTVVQNSDNSATISGCSRGLSPVQPYTASTSLQFAHAGGSTAILSDPPQLFDDLYDYVNDLGLGSTTVAATELASGFVELATQAEMAASTILGLTGSNLVLQSRYATSVAPTSGSYIPVTGSDGNLDRDFLATSSKEQGVNVVWLTTGGTSTWTVPTGITRAFVEVVGEGGGGGGCNAAAGNKAAGGGGGGGGYAAESINLYGTSSIQYYVASSTTYGGTGANGATTTFGSYLSAGGGKVGADEGAGGLGGTGYGGDINIYGEEGGTGYSDNGSTAIGHTVKGGASRYGFGANSNRKGELYGGGAGGVACNPGSSAAGFYGAQGLIKITY